jgi:hypothetical protein
LNRWVKAGLVTLACILCLLIGQGVGSSGKTVTLTKTVTRTVTHVVYRTAKAAKAAPSTSTPTASAPASAADVMSGNGTFIVGYGSGDWRPGTWQTSGAQGGSAGNCYWATLSNLSGSDNSIISNDNVTGPTVLQVGASVAGVQVSGCNDWHRL